MEMWISNQFEMMILFQNSLSRWYYLWVVWEVSRWKVCDPRIQEAQIYKKYSSERLMIIQE